MFLFKGTGSRPPLPGGVVGQTIGGDAKKRVLVVDDEPAVTRLISRVLKTGYDVRTAPTGEEALATMASFTPDLLIVDKNLPRMSGMELVKMARSQLPQLPVIVITGAPEALHGNSERIDVYLAKPFRSIDLLRDAVAEAFERQRSAQERVELQRKLDEVVAQLRRN
jgi:CheY-like chemotaxis protein